MNTVQALIFQFTELCNSFKFLQKLFLKTENQLLILRLQRKSSLHCSSTKDRIKKPSSCVLVVYLFVFNCHDLFKVCLILIQIHDFCGPNIRVWDLFFKLQNFSHTSRTIRRDSDEQMMLGCDC